MSMKVSDMRSYIKNGMNILITGKHGSGKTSILKEACEKEGLNFKFFNASTMDPYLELIGIPNPHVENNTFSMMQPNNGVTDAEVIMIDEPNRAADMSVMNALFELVQFHSVNGVKLPNLKCIVSAMNPAGSANYQVMEMDDAFVDRFDLVIESDPAPSKSYFVSKFGHNVGTVLVNWHRHLPNDDDHYVSARRLEIIGNVWNTIHTKAALEGAMPPKGRFPTTALYRELQKAESLDKTIVSNASNGIDATASVYSILAGNSVGNVKATDVEKVINDIGGRNVFISIFENMNVDDRAQILVSLTKGVNAIRFFNKNKDLLSLDTNDTKNVNIQFYMKMSSYSNPYSMRNKASELLGLMRNDKDIPTN